MVQDGWEIAKRALLEQKYDLLILDELNIALAHNMLPVEEVVRFLKGQQGARRK
jgi:cob(I)alamin adenosyltransferase